MGAGTHTFFQAGTTKAALSVAAVAAVVGGVAAQSHELLAAAAFFVALAAARRPENLPREAGTIVARLSVAVVALAALVPPFDLWLRSALAAGVVALVGATIAAFSRSRSANRGEATVLVGEAEDVTEAARLFANYPVHGVRPVATATPDGFVPTVLPGGGIESVPALIAQHGATHVLTVSPSVSAKLELTLGRDRPVGVRLSALPPLSEILTGNVEVVNVRGLAVRHPRPAPSPRRRGVGREAHVRLRRRVARPRPACSRCSWRGQSRYESTAPARCCSARSASAATAGSSTCGSSARWSTTPRISSTPCVHRNEAEWRVLQDRARPARDPRRSMAAPDVDRRAPAARQRDPRRDEPGRAPPVPGLRAGRGSRGVRVAPAVPARHHRSVAGRRPLVAAAPRGPADGSLLHRALEPRARPAHPACALSPSLCATTGARR